MAHIGNRFILLEKDGLSDGCRCLLKVHSGEEIAQFHLWEIHLMHQMHQCNVSQQDITLENQNSDQLYL